MNGLLTVLLGMSAWAGPKLGDGKPGAESPEALVAELADFDTWREFDQMLTCMAPGYREEVSSMMIGIILMGHAMQNMDPATNEVDPKAIAAMDKALKKHGLKSDMGPEELQAKLAKVDIKKLIEDIVGLAFGDKVGPDAQIPQSYGGSIEGLEIDGKHATAKVDGELTHFVKVKGAWFLDRAPEGWQSKESQAGAAELVGTWKSDRMVIVNDGQQMTIQHLDFRDPTKVRREVSGKPVVEAPNKLLLDEGDGGSVYYFALQDDVLHFGNGSVYPVADMSDFHIEEHGGGHFSRKGEACRMKADFKHDERDVPCTFDGTIFTIDEPKYVGFETDEIRSWMTWTYHYVDGKLIGKETWDATFTKE